MHVSITRQKIACHVTHLEVHPLQGFLFQGPPNPLPRPLIPLPALTSDMLETPASLYIYQYWSAIIRNQVLMPWTQNLLSWVYLGWNFNHFISLQHVLCIGESWYPYDTWFSSNQQLNNYYVMVFYCRHHRLRYCCPFMLLDSTGRSF